MGQYAFGMPIQGLWPCFFAECNSHIVGLAFSARGDRFVSGSEEAVFIWKTKEDGNSQAIRPKRHMFSVRACSPLGSQVAMDD
jgi:hypothetical protein